ncbi:kinase-like domain-containing protein [Lipomyces arxii]|uniref:kinase-like domain-containing protein n=1 Tax=Lipomyces arxii TaxID=56418 RepID=UPI0034CFDB9B
MCSALAPALHHQQKTRTRKRSPNWAEFYRNGYPTDVITIDDDTPPPVNSESDYSNSSSAASRGSGSASSSSSSSASSTTVSAATSSISHIILQTDSASSTPRANPINQLVQNLPPLPASDYTQRQQPLPQKLPVYADRNYALSCMVPQETTVFDIEFDQPTPVPFAAKRRKYGPDVPQSVKPLLPLMPVSATAVSADLAKRRKVEYIAPKKPVAKAKDVVVTAISDPYFQRHNLKVDDDDGHYIIVPDSELTARYQITNLLGQGTFGKVVAAYDRKNRTQCAIKIIRAVQKYRDASKIELRVLETLSMHDQFNLNRCIHLRDCFDYRNHICIVTDLLSISVFDFLKSNEFVPFPVSHIQRFAKQLFTSVAFLHELNLIHTDLKPENILLVNNTFTTYPYNKRGTNNSRKILNDTTIHLIDFGSATFQDEYHSSVVSTRHYRAPEIILGMGWSFPCDLWSIGCILVEFFTGEALFQTHDNVEHLAMMEVVTGRPFDRTISKSVGRQPAKYFSRTGRLDYPNSATSKTSKKYVRAMKRLDEIIPGRDDEFHAHFLDLLQRIFVYEPGDRISARDALAHPWFKDTYIDEGSSCLGSF